VASRRRGAHGQLARARQVPLTDCDTAASAVDDPLSSTFSVDVTSVLFQVRRAHSCAVTEEPSRELEPARPEPPSVSCCAATFVTVSFARPREVEVLVVARRHLRGRDGSADSEMSRSVGVVTSSLAPSDV